MGSISITINKKEQNFTLLNIVVGFKVIYSDIYLLHINLILQMQIVFLN
jgi:hypothetical protein